MATTATRAGNMLAICARLLQVGAVMATKAITEVVKVGRRGEVALSRRVRAAMTLNEGDELVLTVEEDQVVLRRKARRFHEYLDTLGPKSPS